MKNYLIFSIIAVSLLMISTFVPMAAYGLKAGGVSNPSYGTGTNKIVCGDILCSVDGKQMRLVSQTVALRTINDELVLSGIKGTAEQKNPTIVIRSGFLMSLNIQNQDSVSHTVRIESLNLQRTIGPGTSGVLSVYSEGEGEFAISDVSTGKRLGTLNVVSAGPTVPSFDITSALKKLIPSQIESKPSPLAKAETEIAFKEVSGVLQVVGVEGVSGTNPTLIARTGFVYNLYVTNNDSIPHMLIIEGLNVRTKLIASGQTEMISVFPTTEGEFGYYDETMKTRFGVLKVVAVEPELKVKVPVSFQAVSAPGVITTTIAFEKVGNQVVVKGIVGTSETNPTLVTRTGYVYALTVQNKDSSPHNFVVKDLGIQTGNLSPDGSTVLIIQPSKEGEFAYYDGVTNIMHGKLKIVQVEPKLPLK